VLTKENSDNESRKSSNESKSLEKGSANEYKENISSNNIKWTMSGEIKNKNDRPIASLLSENIEFQQIVKPKNFSSKEITLDIEELIKKRIKDEVYEDVIRKENFSLEKQLNCKIYHGTIQLDHEKSQKSLENILNENGHSKNDKTNNVNLKAEEISGRLNKLLKELDLLCHLRLTLTHFNDLESKKKVINVSDLAASTEHILPIISSNNTKSQHLAPEEISKPSNSIDNTKTLEGYQF
ncbi:MAG: U3 snoRNP protein, partial [Paramarteilia canceri]